MGNAVYTTKTDDQLEGQMNIYEWLNLQPPQKSTIQSLPADFMNPPEYEYDNEL